MKMTMEWKYENEISKLIAKERSLLILEPQKLLGISTINFC